MWLTPGSVCSLHAEAEDSSGAGRGWTTGSTTQTSGLGADKVLDLHCVSSFGMLDIPRRCLDMSA